MFHALKAAWIPRIRYSENKIWALFANHCLCKFGKDNYVLNTNFVNHSFMTYLNSIRK